MDLMQILQRILPLLLHLSQQQGQGQGQGQFGWQQQTPTQPTHPAQPTQSPFQPPAQSPTQSPILSSLQKQDNPIRLFGTPSSSNLFGNQAQPSTQQPSPSFQTLGQQLAAQPQSQYTRR